MDNAIVTQDLSKVYGATVAVKKVNLTIPKGSIYGLVGKNGAGKTTILKMLSGLARPSRGTFLINGVDYKENKNIFSTVSALIEIPGTLPNLSPIENLKIKAIGLGYHYNNQQLEDLLKDVGLDKAKHRSVKTFSLGMKQRLGIALSLIGDPQILLFDEPINALDPQGIIEIRELLLNLKDRGCTIVVSSHILDELSKIATHFAFIDKGEIKLETRIEDLNIGHNDILVVSTTNNVEAVKILREKGFNVLLKGNKFKIEDFNGKQSEINIILENANINVLSISQETSSLEEVFLNITKGGEGYNG